MSIEFSTNQFAGPIIPGHETYHPKMDVMISSRKDTQPMTSCLSPISTRPLLLVDVAVGSSVGSGATAARAGIVIGRAIPVAVVVATIYQRSAILNSSRRIHGNVLELL